MLKNILSKNSILGSFFQSQATGSTFASKVLMVEPTNFFLNEETSQDNKFMQKLDMDQSQST